MGLASALSFPRVVLAAALGGLIAGLSVAIYHFWVTEPIIEQAISLEALMHPAETDELPMVTREAQRIGLFVASALYGVTWGLFLSVFYELARRWRPTFGAWQLAAVLSVASCWSLALFPFLKYPANPPGIGDPATITYRQELYLAILVLSVVGTAVAFLAVTANRRRWPWVLVALLGFDLVAYLLLPTNPDAIAIPLDLLQAFRLRSAIGLAMFWALLGVFFALSLQRFLAVPTQGSGRQPAT